MNLKYSREVRERIRTLPPEIKRGIKTLLEGLAEDPYLGKPLQMELDGFWSVAYKRYRLIYKIVTSKKEILIYTLGHRREIYEEVARAVMLGTGVR